MQISQAVIVEGKYDKQKVKAALGDNVLVVPINGFSIFSDKPMQRFVRELAETQGIIVLMDNDTAGFRIRNFIKNIVGKADRHKIIHAYVPDRIGKEKRKNIASAEGLLGVEGFSVSELASAINTALKFEETPIKSRTHGRITKADLMQMGLYGTSKSAENREEYCETHGLPKKISTNLFLEILNNEGEIDD